MSNRLIYLFDNSMYTDCSFLVGTGSNQEVIYAHKLILIQASSVFEDMLAKAHFKVLVPGSDPAIFKMLLCSIYSDNVSLDTLSNAIQLYSLADTYNVDFVKEICLEYINQPKYRNSFEVYRFLRDHHLEEEAGLFEYDRNPRSQQKALAYGSYCDSDDEDDCDSELVLSDCLNHFRITNDASTGERVVSRFKSSIGSGYNLPVGWEHMLLQASKADDVVSLKKVEIDRAFSSTRDPYGWTLLHFAVDGRSLNLVKCMLSSRSIDVNCQTTKGNGHRPEGSTPLHLAAWNGDVKMAKLLLAYGADPYIRDAKGKNSINRSCSRGYPEVSAVLKGEC